MSDSVIKRVLVLGTLAIIGIVVVQSYWLLKTWDIKDKEFDQSINIALRKVAETVAKVNSTTLPRENIIQRRSSNLYAVNVNTEINTNILEDYLYQELSLVGITTDFEYGVYDCKSAELVYGNYCKLSPNEKPHKKSYKLPKFKDFDYYFVVKFPQIESYFINNLWTNVLFFGVAILSILFFTYSILVIIQQKRLSELQKDFINNMTHEFKTPISSIKIASEVLKQDPTINQDQRLTRYSSIIWDQNQRLNEQVEKVLNIARLENSNLKLKRSNFDLVELVESIVENEQLKLTEGSIELTSKLKVAQINADLHHLTNVLYNIIENAQKYCEKTPQIDVTISESKDHKGYALSIKDNGIGIKKENQKLLFEKFYRVSTGNVHDVKGFGLGLFYVKSICDAHQWQIIVQSEFGKGTTFTIFIPKLEQ